MSALWLFVLGTILVTGGFVVVTELTGAGVPIHGAPSFSAVLDEVTEIAEKIDEQISGRTSEAAGGIVELLGDLPEQLGVKNDDDDAPQPDVPPSDDAIAEPSATGAPNPESDDNPEGPADFGAELGNPPDVAAEDSGEQNQPLGGPDDGTSPPGDELSGSSAAPEEEGEENVDDDSRQNDPDSGGNGRRVDVCQSGGSNTVTVDQHGGAALVTQGGEEGACES